MLYEVKKEETHIINEINCIDNYFDLVQMRIEKAEQLEKTIEIENEQLQIAPLLLLSLIENGVKHSGIIYASDAKLKVAIRVLGNELSLIMENSITQVAQSESTGIGLHNLKKRLAINYPNRHMFTFETNEGIAYTKLILSLKK